MASSGGLVKLLKAGQGKQGYCKLCSLSDPVLQDEFDKRVRMLKPGRDAKHMRGWVYTPEQLNEYLGDRIEGFKPVNRQTIYSHRKHVMHPQDKLVTAVKKHDLEHSKGRPQTSDQEFLDAVISLGYANAIADPDRVSVDHALKATQIKSQSKDRGSAHQTLVAIFTGGSKPPDIIEGDVTEVP